MTPQQALAMLNAHAAQLSEHFEAVQILASFPTDGGTQPVKAGRGNWFARQGMAHDFIKQDEAQQIAHEITQSEEQE